MGYENTRETAAGPPRMAAPGAAVAPVSTATFNNASVWANLTASWTRYAPSLEDLLLAGPRMLTRLGSIISFPEAVDSFGQRVVPDPTGSDYFVTVTATATEMAADISEAVANTANILEDDQDPAALVSRFTMEGSAKGLGSVFSYATSKWALCCIAMVRRPLSTPPPLLYLHKVAVGYHLKPHPHIRCIPTTITLNMAYTSIPSFCAYSPVRLSVPAATTGDPMPDFPRLRRNAMGQLYQDVRIDVRRTEWIFTWTQFSIAAWC